MDIKKQYFELIKKNIDFAYESQKDKLKKIAYMFGECMDNEGVVQLFGVKHGEEFVNELNYRAGGIAPFHALKLRDMMLKGLIDQKDIETGEIYNDLSVVDKFSEAFDLDDRDMYCVVSYYGREPLAIEIAKRAKKNNQKVVAVVNKKAYDACKGTLLDYCDEYLDMCCDHPDVAIELDGIKIGQLSSTVANVIAQMLTAEIYAYFKDNNKEAPVLLSANINGADVHNNSLTEPYGRRIR